MAFLDEEIRCGFKVKNNRKVLWQKEIVMLEWLEDVCQKEGLDYFLIGGSEIGVVRHKGFIPWDDDIDIGMLRPYFDRFLAIYQKYLPAGYSVQFGLDEKHHIWSNILRIRDNAGTGIIDNQIGKDVSHGVFIELYPYDEVPEDVKTQKRLAWKVSGYTMILQEKIGQTKAAGKRAKLLRVLYSHLSAQQLADKIDRVCRQYNGTGQRFVSIPILPQYLANGEEVLYAEDVEKSITMPFEYSRARIPQGYDRCLTKEYGDYMKLPPVDQRGTHHSTKVFYDPTKPFTYYQERTMKELFDKYGFLL